MDSVEVEIQFQDIHARFAKETQVAGLGMFPYEYAHVFFFHSAFPGNTRYLEFRGRRRNFGVQSGAGSGDEVDGNRRGRTLRLGLLYVGIDPFDQRLIRGSEVRTAARRRVVSRTCVGRPRMKITGFGKGLPDDSGSYSLTGLLNQLSIGSFGKQHLSQTCDR